MIMIIALVTIARHEFDQTNGARSANFESGPPCHYFQVESKTEFDTKRQLVQKRVHAIAQSFIVSICCLVIAGAAYIPLLLLEPA